MPILPHAASVDQGGAGKEVCCEPEVAEAIIPCAEVVEVDGTHNAWSVRPRRFDDAVDGSLSKVIWS